MPTAVKVRMGELDYGWMFKISDFVDLLDYWEKVRSLRVQEGFSNLLRSRELADLTGVSQAGAEHLSHGDAFGIYSKAFSVQGTCLDAVSSYAKDIVSSMLKTMHETGVIYVNSKGGYFSIHPSLEEYAPQEIEQWVLPGEKISVKKWPGGKHWYAQIGGTSVVRNGENKWSSKAMAELNAEKWAKENGITIEETE